MKLRRSTAILLIISAIISCSVCILQRTVYAAGTGYFYVTGLPANIRSAPGTDKSRLVKLFSPTYLIYTNKTAEVNGAEWYSIRYDDGGKTRDGWILGSLGYLTGEKNEESSAQSGSGKTGIGQAEWAWRAYNEGWNYVWGGSKAGTVAKSDAATQKSANISDKTASSAKTDSGTANDPACDGIEPQDNIGLAQVCVKSASCLNIRSGAGPGYPVAGRLYDGDMVNYLESKTIGGQVWYSVVYKNKTAWICGKPDPNTSYLKILSVPMRTGPAAYARSSTETVMTGNTQKTGYTEDRKAVGKIRVAVKCLNIRTDSRASADRIGVIYMDSTADYYSIKKEGSETWYQISFRGVSGWVCGRKDTENVYAVIVDRDEAEKTSEAAIDAMTSSAAVYGDTDHTSPSDETIETTLAEDLSR